jgi:hypothetical protein
MKAIQGMKRQYTSVSEASNELTTTATEEEEGGGE